MKFLGRLASRIIIMDDQDKKPFHCNICGKDFSLSLTFKAHTMLHKREAPYKCGWCGEVFVRNSIELKNHMRKHLEADSEDEHNTQDLFCKLCKKKLSTKGSLKKHMELHDSDVTYACKVCRKSFVKKEYLRIHMHKRHTGEKPTFTCEICREVYESKTALARHFRQHKDELQYKCKDCLKVFRSKKVLGNHVKRKHCVPVEQDSHETSVIVSDLRMYINPIEDLSDSMVVKDQLDGIESSIVEKQYTCSTCGKQLNSQKSVLNHMLMHAETVLYSCKVCGIAFSDRTLLCKHKESHESYGEAKDCETDLCEVVENQEKITLYIKNDSSPKLNNKRKVFMLEERGPCLDQTGQTTNKKWRQGAEKDRKEDVMVINEDVVIEVEEVIIAEKEDDTLDSAGGILNPLL